MNRYRGTALNFTVHRGDYNEGDIRFAWHDSCKRQAEFYVRHRRTSDVVLSESSMRRVGGKWQRRESSARAPDVNVRGRQRMIIAAIIVRMPKRVDSNHLSRYKQQAGKAADKNRASRAAGNTRRYRGQAVLSLSCAASPKRWIASLKISASATACSLRASGVG